MYAHYLVCHITVLKLMAPMVLGLFQVIRPYHPSLSLSFTTTMSMDIMRMTWVSVIMDHPSLNCRNRDFLAEERWFGKTDTISFATKTCTPFKLQVHSIHCQKKYFFSCYTMYQWRYFWKRVQVWIKTFFWSSISRYFYCDISCHDISVSFMTLSHKLSFYDIYYETICSAFALLKKYLQFCQKCRYPSSRVLVFQDLRLVWLFHWSNCE